MSRHRIPDLSGQKFGRLTVLAPAPRRHRLLYWHCRCDCGVEREVYSWALTAGKTQSCGCWRSELLSARDRTHGMTGIPEYGVWQGMIARCTRQTDPAFVNYGGRGITVCDRWQQSFAAFIADMGRRPTPAHTLDRRDNDRGYSPGNCRWATRPQQNRNRRGNVLLTHAGRTLTIVEWAEEVGLPHSCLRWRLAAGWPPTKALETPSERHPTVFLAYQGRTLRLVDWAEETGLPQHVIRLRLEGGWSTAEALTRPLRHTRRSKA